MVFNYYEMKKLRNIYYIKKFNWMYWRKCIILYDMKMCFNKYEREPQISKKTGNRNESKHRYLFLNGGFKGIRISTKIRTRTSL